MTTTPDAAVAVSSHLHPATSWEVEDHPVPTGREEVWRFTPVERLAGLFDPDAPEASLHWDVQLRDGATLTRIDAPAARSASVSAPADRLAAVAASKAVHPVRLDIPSGAVLDEPILLDGAGREAAAVGRMVVNVGAGAKATVVLRYTGLAEYSSKFDVRVGEGAQLTLVSVQDWADGAVHGGETSFLVGRDATVRTVEVTLGGSVVRLTNRAEFAGPGGTIEQYGLYFADAGQHLEHRLFVDHNEPHTHSNVDYRGALQGAGAHSVWIGDVLIRKNAEAITTYEQNRNLVLTDGCVADSVPNLEIETGEIGGAGHSSTTGRFDDEHLFYLMSRGIPESEARRLVVEGFFVEIIRRIGVPDLEAKLLDAIRGELAATVTA